METSSGGLEDREARAAKNQSLFREINERIGTLNQGFSSLLPEGGDWVCECANMSCIELISMTVDEYEAVRAVPNRFLVAPADAHVWTEVERIVERADRYWVVEKSGRSGALAAEANPRAAR